MDESRLLLELGQASPSKAGVRNRGETEPKPSRDTRDLIKFLRSL